MMSVANKHSKLRVVMLSVYMLNVVAPEWTGAYLNMSRFFRFQLHHDESGSTEPPDFTG